MRIMIIDDDPLIRQLLTYQLGGAGYHVSTASSGQDGLGRLLYEQPDLVLLDVVMPGMNGWDVCDQIRAYSSIPVIMLTAKNADMDVVAGFKSGADDYIAKPFSQRQLLARIEAVLRRSRPPAFPPGQSSYVPAPVHVAPSGAGTATVAHTHSTHAPPYALPHAPRQRGRTPPSNPSPASPRRATGTRHTDPMVALWPLFVALAIVIVALVFMLLVLLQPGLMPGG